MKIAVRIQGLGPRLADAQAARLAEQAARATPATPPPAPIAPSKEPPR